MKKEQKIIIVAGVAILLALVVVIIIAKPGLKNADTLKNSISNSVADNFLVIEEKSFDFGSISMAAGKINHSFKIKNSGSQDVMIKKMYTSCMCTVASLIKGSQKYGPFGMAGHGFVPPVNQSVKVGEEAMIEIVFDPAAHGPAGVGKIERVIYIETENNQTSEIIISANVTP